MLATTDGQGQPRSANAVKSPQNRKKKKLRQQATLNDFFFCAGTWCRNATQK